MPSPPSAVVHDEQTLAWELRAYWAAARSIVLTLSERCVVGRVEGLVQYVAASGAYVIVDGWHVPVVDVRGIVRPHHTQAEARPG